MVKKDDAYAKAGVNYQEIGPFKDAMIKMGKQTLAFPNKRGVYIDEELLHAHGAVYWYNGNLSHRWGKTTEGLGNKNWIAEWMYQFAGTGRTYYEGIGIDSGLMAVNDLIAQGLMPVIYTDEVAAGDSEWFADERRSKDLAKSFYRLCEMCGMALPAGESPALRYLVNAEPPVKSAPSLSGCATGIAAPASRIITGRKLQPGDHIVAVKSSGPHANGYSLVIKKALELPEKFLTEISTGNMLGEEALTPTQSYVALIEAWLENELDIHALLPGTGGGLAKIAFDSRSYSYNINNWWTKEEIHPIFQFMGELGVTLEDLLKTFNMNGGYYGFMPKDEVDQAIGIGEKLGHELIDIGSVKKGQRKVVINKGLFSKNRITLLPPGE